MNLKKANMGKLWAVLPGSTIWPSLAAFVSLEKTAVKFLSVVERRDFVRVVDVDGHR